MQYCSIAICSIAVWQLVVSGPQGRVQLPPSDHLPSILGSPEYHRNLNLLSILPVGAPGTPNVSHMSTLVLFSAQKDHQNGAPNRENPSSTENVILTSPPTPNRGFNHPKYLRNWWDFVAKPNLESGWPSHMTKKPSMAQAGPRRWEKVVCYICCISIFVVLSCWYWGCGKAAWSALRQGLLTWKWWHRFTTFGK